MEIRCRIVDGVVILDLEGNIYLGRDTQDLRTQVKAFVRAGVRRMILNLQGVKNLDSSGLGEMISSFASMTREGGQIKLLHLNPRIHRLMSLTKLLTVFDVFEDERKAVESFLT